MIMVRVITLALFLLQSVFVFGQNLALNKPYSVAPNPNYKDTALPNDKTSLTDGKRTQGYFWKSRSTVGWKNTGKIIVNIDLKTPNVVGKVKFSTGSYNRANVYSPSNVFVFGSLDNNSYSYLGDLSANFKNSDDKYNLHELELNIKASNKFRYFQLVIIPQGLYAFVDEIEIIKANSAKSGNIANDIQRSDIDIKVNALLGSNDSTQKQSFAVSSKMKKVQATTIFDWCSQWSSLTQASFKFENSTSTDPLISFPVNGEDYRTFVLTNNGGNDTKYTLKISEANTFNAQLFLLPYVTSMVGKKSIPDPLLAFGSDILIKAGESKIFMLKLKGVSKGKDESNILISSSGGNIKIPFNTSVQGTIPTNNLSLNANVWAYLNSPVISKYKVKAVQNLSAHHVNTIVVPPEKLGRLNGSDFSEFKNYLVNFVPSNTKNIILYVNFLSKENVGYFSQKGYLSAASKEDFKNWFNSIKSIVSGAGFKSNIYIYPYDEISDLHVKDLTVLMEWAKKEIPGIKFYTTIGNKNIQPNSFNKIANNLDIIQFADTKHNMELANTITDPKVQKWIYDAKPQAELLSPYSYYRLMAWKAFYYNLNGVGFWNYSDYKATPNDDVIKTLKLKSSVNYSVIYINDQNIINSRRWEAFKLGIEDYEIINNYSSNVGIAKAKALVKKVIDNPDDLTLADESKRIMLNAL